MSNRRRKSNKGGNLKKICERYHFSKRCEERLGHQLKQKDLVRMIHDKKLEFYYRASNSRTLWIYEEDGKEYVIVYDKERKTIVTIYKYDNKKEWEKFLGRELSDNEMVYIQDTVL